MGATAVLLGVSDEAITGATASPPVLRSGGSSSSFLTGVVRAIPSGGVGPFTYAWSIVSTTHVIVASSPTVAATAFTISGILPGAACEAEAACSITDTSTGAVQQVSVSISHRDTRGLSNA